MSLKTAGYIEPIRDIENQESFGVSKLEEFTWKQIFDSDACTKCGRCQDGCPAYLSGKHLSPKKLVQDIKTFWLEQAPLAAAKAVCSRRRRCGSTGSEKALVGEVVSMHELWELHQLYVLCGRTAPLPLNMYRRLSICRAIKF